MEKKKKKVKSFEKIERIVKVCIVFGELRPRSRKVFGCGGKGTARRRCGRGLPRAGLIVVFRQDGEASTDRMSANPRGGGAVLRKRFLDASAASVHRLLTSRTLRTLREDSFADFVRDPEWFSACVKRYFPLRTKRNFVRFANSVTAFH